MRKQLFALSLTALLPIGVAQAVENTVQPETKPQQQSSQRADHWLSPEQRQSMRELRMQHRQEQQALYQQTWEKLPKSERDAYAAQRKQLREQNRTQVRALLTPEQQKKFTQWRTKAQQNDRMHRHSKRQKRHGHSAKQRTCS